jgi:TRAP-type C4-dicarboxylate transport system permease small subunit
MPDQTLPRSWRRWLRFSVRGLIIVVLLIGGWLGWLVRSAHVQRDAVVAI